MNHPLLVGFRLNRRYAASHAIIRPRLVGRVTEHAISFSARLIPEQRSPLILVSLRKSRSTRCRPESIMRKNKYDALRQFFRCQVVVIMMTRNVLNIFKRKKLVIRRILNCVEEPSLFILFIAGQNTLLDAHLTK